MSSDPPNPNPLSVLTGICLVPSSGGVPRTMEAFRDALSAKVVSFTTGQLLDSEPSAFADIEQVRVGDHLLGRSYMWAPKRRRLAAERLVAEADHLTCHVMLRYHALWVWRWARRRGIPFWFIPHGQLDPYVYTYRAPIKKLWLRLYGKRLLKAATHVIYATRQEQAKASWIHGGGNGRVIHWPVHLVDTSNRQEARIALRQRIGAPNGARVLVYLGRLHRMKRPLETIRAFASGAQPGTHLVVAGMDQGLSEAACRKAALEAGAGERIHVLGGIFGVEKEQLLLGADGYISLSIRENFGHTAAESLSAGLPVILSPGNDLAADLRESACGWFLDSDDPEEAGAAIRAWEATEPGLLRSMGDRGRLYIETECAFSQFKKKLCALRDEALSGHIKDGKRR